MSDIVLVGGGGHARSVADAALRAGYTIAGVLDPKGEPVLNIPCLGGDEMIKPLADKGCQFVITYGGLTSSRKRVQLFEKVMLAGGTLAVIVAASATVSPFAEVGGGTVVLEGARVNAGADIYTNAIINTGAIVEHDCVVGNNTHISTGAVLNGGAQVYDNCLVGSHATVLQGVHIAEGSTIGAGAVVLHTIRKSGGTWVGCPARQIH